MDLKEIQRNGTRLIKYKRNTLGTKHLYLYKYKAKLYAFTLYKGSLYNDNLNYFEYNEDIKPVNKYKLTSILYYSNSSLNEWFKHKDYILNHI